ncbi:MAG TPA: putative quinol monooxygenase [Acidimicrobiales bacterium]|jgi:quinol monooxygenase YgiN|nr:putative quinol monooxygenase [Acidimicrobiales bacterium]
MPKVAVHVKLPATPGKGDELVAAFTQIYEAGGLDTEPGTIMHVIHQAKDDPDTVYFYEVYEDQAALDAHSQGPVLKAVYPKLAGLVAGAPEMVVLSPKNAHGLEL